MKRSLLKIGLAVILSAIFSVSLPSCSSETEFTPNRNNLFLEEDIDILSSGYSDLYSDLFKIILQEYKEISVSDADVDIDKYFKYFAELYVSQLTPEENKLLKRGAHLYDTRSSDEPNKIITVPDEFVNKIKPIMFDEDVSLLTGEINKFYNSQYFLNLNAEEQQELKIQLESLKKIRNSVIDILIDHFQHENIMTRISPGDRMIWSQAVSQMTDEQRSKLIDAGLAGIALVSSGPAAAVVTIVALAKSLFW